MAEENKLQEMIRTSLENIRAMVDANTVVGTPIETPAGTTIIPISKISVGYASGGVDFSAAKDRELTCIHALALPGKTAPLTAGIIIKDTIMNILKREEFLG